MSAVTISQSGQGNAVQEGDAYKGDGLFGIGELLKGIATAYKNTDIKEEVIADHLQGNQAQRLDDLANAITAKYLSDEFSKAKAISDAKDAVRNIFHEYADEFLPKIYSAGCEHGIYNSTTMQLLANDAYARAVRKGAELVLKNINDYAQREIERGQLALQSFSTLISAYSKQNKTYFMDEYPKTGKFAQDAAILIIAFTIMDAGKWINRKYFAES